MVATIFINVVFPAPFGPSKPTVSPSRTLNEILAQCLRLDFTRGPLQPGEQGTFQVTLRDPVNKESGDGFLQDCESHLFWCTAMHYFSEITERSSVTEHSHRLRIRKRPHV